MKIGLIFCKIDDVFDRYKAGVFSIFESNPPLGLGAIGSVALNRGHQVKIFDQQLEQYSNEELIDEVLKYNPDIIGFSCTSLNIENSLICTRKIKSIKNKIIFAGGIHITLCTKEVSNLELYDFLISGEGEEVFEKILICFENEKDLKKINVQGLWLKGENIDRGCAVLTTVNKGIIERSIFNINKYKNKGALLSETPCYSLFSSRGCPYKCKFCSKPDYFKIYRQREIDEVIKEIKYLIKNFQCKSISFREDNFTVDIERLKEFCNRMIEEFDGAFFWECESRADLPKEILEIMYRAGCRGIWCGIETIVSKWQNWIEKKLKKERIIEFYGNCQKIGIKTGALFIFGFPTQTKEEIEEDIQFAISLPTEFSAFQCLAIFPGSLLLDFYKEGKNCAFITKNVALSLINGKSPEEMISLEEKINRRIRSTRLNYRG
jgi:radical SAM superfamily enzyme YgiQ (UPF0313 family)